MRMKRAFVVASLLFGCSSHKESSAVAALPPEASPQTSPAMKSVSPVQTDSETFALDELPEWKVSRDKSYPVRTLEKGTNGHKAKDSREIILHVANVDGASLQELIEGNFYPQRLKDESFYLRKTIQERVSGRYTGPQALAMPAWLHASPRQKAEGDISFLSQAGGKTGRKADVDFVNADAMEILQLMAQVGGLQMVVAPNLPKVPIDIYVRQVPWDQVYESIVSLVALRSQRMGSNVVFVGKASGDWQAPSIKESPIVSIAASLEKAALLKNVLPREGGEMLPIPCNAGPVDFSLDKVPRDLVLAAISFQTGTTYNSDLPSPCFDALPPLPRAIQKGDVLLATTFAQTPKALIRDPEGSVFQLEGRKGAFRASRRGVHAGEVFLQLRRPTSTGDEDAQSISLELLKGARLAATLRDRNGGGFVLQTRDKKFVTRLQYPHQEPGLFAPAQKDNAVRFEVDTGEVRFFFPGQEKPVLLRLHP